LPAIRGEITQPREAERAGNDQQHQRMAHAPRDAMGHPGPERTFATRQRCDRGQVIGLGRMLHAEQQAEGQDRGEAHEATRSGLASVCVVMVRSLRRSRLARSGIS
jgi:hypothetical protein